MKKYLPYAVGALVLLLVIVSVVFVLRRRGGGEIEEEETVRELTYAERPFASLTPTEDGHYLTLAISEINVDAASMEYLLEYVTDAGITQGVPGNIMLNGKTEIEPRNLLMGSESSGKFRYDEGVEEGKLTIRFRDDKGKTIGKVSTDFHLQSNTDELTSIDGNFSYTLEDLPAGGDVFFVTMSTFRVPGQDIEPAVGPYGVFASTSDKLPGEYMLGGETYSADDIGVFFK